MAAARSLLLLRALHQSPLLRDGYQVVVAGGGIMGCSSAYFLAKRMPPEQILVVEKDPTYITASTVLSVGSIRQQFSCPVNIALCQHSFQFLQEVGHHLTVDKADPPDIQFVHGGYLFLASTARQELLLQNYQTQRKMGVAVKLLTPSQLQYLYPWMDTTGIGLATVGVHGEGWFDPWSLLIAFKKKIQSMGVHVCHGEVTGLNVSDRVRSVTVQTAETNKEVSCEYFLNAAGPHAAAIANMAGIGCSNHTNPIMRTPYPVRPRKRMVFVFNCPQGPKDNLLVIDSSGVYSRRESATTFICGLSPTPDEDKDAAPLEVDYSFFEERVWPKLAERIPAFEALKVKHSWAGYYEYNTLDQNGIIGCHPLLGNYVFANGFSGHGIQQSPAVGRAVSEIILDGQSKTIDVTDLSFDRIVSNTPFREQNIV